MEELLEKYREMVGRGICAHAAAASIVSYSYMLGKERGDTAEEALAYGGKVLAAIRKIWTEEEA